MPDNNWNFTNSWWDPYQNQWSELGYFSPEMLSEAFGGMWFDYNSEQATVQAQFGEMQVDNLEKQYLSWSAKEQSKLDYQQAGNQMISRSNISSLLTDKEFMNDQNELDKKKIIQDTVATINNSTSEQGKMQLASSPFEDSQNAVVDSVHDKIAMANTTNRFKNRKIDSDVDIVKDKTGYYDNEGVWHAGREETLRIAQYDADNVARHTELQHGADEIEYITRKNQLEIYEDWAIGQTDLIKRILWEEPASDSLNSIDDLLAGIDWGPSGIGVTSPNPHTDITLETFNTNLTDIMADFAANCESICMESADKAACMTSCNSNSLGSFFAEWDVQGDLGGSGMYQMVNVQELYNTWDPSVREWFDGQDYGDEMSYYNLVEVVMDYYAYDYGQKADICAEDCNGDNDCIVACLEWEGFGV
jgi:hypothetical protein